MQGLELRKNSWRTPKKLIEGSTEAKEPQKRHVQGSDGKTGKKGGWSVSDELGGGSASPESGSRAHTRRPEKRAWMVSGSGALGQIGDLLQALLAV